MSNEPHRVRGLARAAVKESHSRHMRNARITQHFLSLAVENVHMVARSSNACRLMSRSLPITFVPTPCQHAYSKYPAHRNHDF